MLQPNRLRGETISPIIASTRFGTAAPHNHSGVRFVMLKRCVVPAFLVAFLAFSFSVSPAPAATTAVGDTGTTVTLFDNFSSDTPGLAPNLAIPGAPAGDFLTLSELAGTVRVNSMIDGLTMAAQMKQSNGIGGVALFGWPASPPPGTERITVGWRSVAQDDNPITIVACTVRGTNGALVASIEYGEHGSLTWNGLAGAAETLPIAYRQNRNNAFILSVDLLAQTVSLSIDGVAIAGFQNRAFAQATTDVARIGFEAGGSAPQTFAVDDLFATAFARVPDLRPVVTAPALVTGAEASSISFSVSAADPDGDAISSLAAAPLPAGAGFTANASNTSGDFAWTPTFTQAGSYSVVFTAQNALAGTAATAIEVSGTDRPPVVDTPASAACEERGRVTFTASASDPDGDVFAPLTADLSPLPAGHTATFTSNAGDGTGLFDWSPPLGSAGVYPIVITASAGGSSAQGTTTVYVAAFGTATVGRFIWTPTNADVGGSWSVTFTATNPLNESTDVTVPLIVLPAGGLLLSPTPRAAAGSRLPNLAPQAIQKGPVVDVRGSNTGVGGTTMTLTATATDAGTLTAGRFTVQRSGQTSSSSTSTTASQLTLTANLSGLPDENDAVFLVDKDPVVNVPAPVSGNVGSPVNVHVGAADPDGDPIDTFTADLSTLPAGHDAVFTVNGTSTLGTLTWTPTISDSGTFFVTFTATNRLVGQNTVEIRVHGVAAARVFQVGGKKISLASGKPVACVQVEPIGGSFSLDNVDFRSIAMISEGTGTVSRISASTGKSIVVGDRDNNLIEDATVCFAKSDLRALFSLLRGSNSVPVVIEGNLLTGGRFHGGITLDVSAGGGKLAAAIYPNPLNPRATLGFTTAKSGFVRVRLFDLNGRMVRQLLDTPTLEAGHHEVAIDGADAEGRRLASGVYFYRVDAREGTSQGRFAIVK